MLKAVQSRASYSVEENWERGREKTDLGKFEE